MSFKYFGWYHDEDRTFLMVLPSRSKEEFMGWFRGFTNTPLEIPDEEIINDFGKMNRTIRECSVVPLQ